MQILRHSPTVMRFREISPYVVLSEVRGSDATKDESKDPENVSFATPRQGILPKLLPYLLIRGKQNERGFESTPCNIVVKDTSPGSFD
jgi:hypothetical protein